jgi:hypothetical protein
MIMTTDQNEKNHRIYDAIAHEDALDAADRRELTSTERDEAHRFVDQMRARVLDEQRARRTHRDEGARVRPSILAMARDAILRRLGELFDSHPGAVFAHRDLTMMSDHDLRTALEDAESLVERIS